MIKHVAILCDYKLLPDRIGGMDHFFWAFDDKCKKEGVVVDWFFPNEASFERYSQLSIFSSETLSIEATFLAHLQQHQKSYDVIVTHFLELCTPFYKELKSKIKAKIITIDHNPRPLLGYSKRKKVLKRLKGRLYSKYIDLLVGVSNYTVNEIIKDFGKHVAHKTLTVYNGVIIDHIAVQTARNTTNPRFLVASHLRASKGIQDLINAVALLNDDILNNLTIDIYGDGPFKATLKNIVLEKKLDTVFTFMGNSPNLNTTYASYDYMLQPTHMECFSLSILESLAANVPVITTNVGGNEEAVIDGENGFVFKAKDTNSLIGILERICKGEQRITANTRENIERNFSIELMVKKHFEIL